MHYIVILRLADAKCRGEGKLPRPLNKVSLHPVAIVELAFFDDSTGVLYTKCTIKLIIFEDSPGVLHIHVADR